MLDKLKAEWQELKRAPSGQRFVQCHERHQARDAPYLKPLLFFAAIFSFVVGVVLVFIPGPAILFFAISGALLAAESHAVASAFDKVETVLHRIWFAYRGRRRKRDARAKTQKGRLDERELEAAVRAAVAAKHAPSDRNLNGHVPPSLGKVDMSSLQPRAADHPEAEGEKVDMRNLHPEAAAGAPVDMSSLQPRAAGDVPPAPVPDAVSAPVDMRNLQPVSPHQYDPAAMQPRRETQKQPENPTQSNRPIDQRVVWMPRPPAETKAGPVANAVAREQAASTPPVATTYAPVTRTARPRIAGTMKIWSTEFPAELVSHLPAPTPPRPSVQAKSTIVVFPPPVQVASDDGQTARRGGSAR
jgi:hypothetical protein